MLGILGGTFDPVHFGHLRPALDVAETLKLDEVRLIPCGQPPHRQQPVASALQRLSMLRAAVAGQRVFKVDDREIRRGGPSYMVDTLASLKQDFPDHSLCLILGCDAFLELASWHRWRELFNLANIVVTHRPGWSVKQVNQQSELDKQVKQRQVTVDKLANYEAGKIAFIPVTQLDISATRIRERLKQGQQASYLLPEKVEQIIKMQHIYG
ncbi:MAG: nicotinate-nucleotide adenylyltransferase [Thioalkalispiraceae bacterium]